MKFYSILILLSGFLLASLTNWKNIIPIKNYCTINAVALDSNKTVRLYPPRKEAQQILTDIYKIVPVTTDNFYLKQSPDVEKAVAVHHEGKMYIIYNDEFLRRLTRSEKDKAAIYFIFAHELAHHMNGHTFKEEGSRPDKELEADSAAARILAAMGFSERQTLYVLKHLNKEATETHPSRIDRKFTIISGWESGLKPLKKYGVTYAARPDDIRFTIQDQKTKETVYNGYAGFGTIELKAGEYLVKYFNDNKTKYKTLKVPDVLFLEMSL